MYKEYTRFDSLISTAIGGMNLCKKLLFSLFLLFSRSKESCVKWYLVCTWRGKASQSAPRHARKYLLSRVSNVRCYWCLHERVNKRAPPRVYFSFSQALLYSCNAFLILAYIDSLALYNVRETVGFIHARILVCINVIPRLYELYPCCLKQF